MIEKTIDLDNFLAPSNRRFLFRSMVIILAVVLAVGFALWLIFRAPAPQGVRPKAAANASLTVTDTTVRKVDWPVRLEASGTIRPWQEAVVGSQIDGIRLIELHASPGDVVRRGQVLARFDSDGVRSELAQTRAELRQSIAQAGQARANRDRALKLRASGSVSEQDVLAAVTLSETAAAQVELRQAQLDWRQLQLRYTTVLAPDDGVISSRSASIGAVGVVGEELFRLIRHNRLEWQGELTASQLGQVARNQVVVLTLPDGRTTDATVRQLAPSLDPQTRLGMAYADVFPASTARAGMYAQGRIIVAQHPALSIPASSVVIRDGRSQVFRVSGQKEAQKVSLQLVTVGRRQATDVEIIQGLDEGDRVVFQGAGFLNDGDIVRISPASASMTTAKAVPGQ